MSTVVAPSLETLIQRRKPGYMLEAPFYTDPGIFETDLDIVFGRHWIHVGVEPVHGIATQHFGQPADGIGRGDFRCGVGMGIRHDATSLKRDRSFERLQASPIGPKQGHFAAMGVMPV